MIVVKNPYRIACLYWEQPDWMINASRKKKAFSMQSQVRVGFPVQNLIQKANLHCQLFQTCQIFLHLIYWWVKIPAHIVLTKKLSIREMFGNPPPWINDKFVSPREIAITSFYFNYFKRTHNWFFTWLYVYSVVRSNSNYAEHSIRTINMNLGNLFKNGKRNVLDRRHFKGESMHARIFTLFTYTPYTTYLFTYFLFCLD